MKALELRQTTVKPILRSVISPILPPKAVQYIRFRWWWLSSYLPRLIGSRFFKRTPQVRTFGQAVNPASLASQLEVNSFAPTKMCRIMSKYGSDKGRMHNYTVVYSALFKQWCDRPLVLLELGLGTNNSDVPSNMGVFGAPGASLRGWQELFPRGRVYGADVDRRILFQENRIETFYCNQLDQSSIRELWSKAGLKNGADIIIEDGLHTFEANVSFLEGSLHHLRPGGIYITEDIMGEDAEKWYDRLATVYSKKYPDYEFAFVNLSNGANLVGNNMLVIRRREESN